MGENGTPKPDIEALNIEAYERVFRKSIDAAERIGRDKGYDADQVLEVARTIFDRFYTDQGVITQAEKSAQAVVKTVSSVLGR